MKKPTEETRILVIDDDPGVLGSIGDLLEFEGYQVETSTKNGVYVEQSLRRGFPDLIILDILLSGHDGRDICKKLKSQDQTKSIPVILISAHPDARNTAFAAGADDFIAKPFDIDDLLDRVARQLAAIGSECKGNSAMSETSLSSRIIALCMGLLAFASVALMAQQLSSSPRSRQSATNFASGPGAAEPSRQDLRGRAEALQGTTPSVPNLTTAPIPQVQTTINVTRQQYENALALWHAQGVSEYDITLIESSGMARGGEMRLRFRIAGGEPRLVKYTDLNQGQPQVIPLDSLGSDELDYLRGLSVEAMFGIIGAVFNEKPIEPPGKPLDPSGPLSEYNVAFAPRLGYPTHIYSRAFLRADGLPVTECCIYYEVLNLEILKSSTPGMPRAGHPGP